MSEEIKQTVDEEVIPVAPSEIHESDSGFTAKAKNKRGNRLLVVILIIVVIGVGTGVLYKQGLLDTIVGDSPSAVTSGDPEKIVATVNDIKITRAELDEKIAQVKKTLPPGAVDPTDDASFELTLLQDLISLKLLTQTAEQKQYTVTDEQVVAERTALVEQLGGEEVFVQRIQELGITEEELTSNMRNELLIRQLLDDETDVDTIMVTDEEIQEAYDQVMAQGNIDSASAPTLEEVSEMLRNEVKNQKSAVLIEEYIEQLKQGATIDIAL